MNDQEERSPINWTRHIITIAVFSAAAALGGVVKIPSPVGSIALDSAPAYFVAAYMHPITGGIVGTIGHFASAASAGFPLGAVHIAVAIQMFFWCLIFGLIARSRNNLLFLAIATVVAVALNGVAGPWLLVGVRVIDRAIATLVVPFLTLASAINVTIAAVAIGFIARGRGR